MLNLILSLRTSQSAERVQKPSNQAVLNKVLIGTDSDSQELIALPKQGGQMLKKPE